MPPVMSRGRHVFVLQQLIDLPDKRVVIASAVQADKALLLVKASMVATEQIGKQRFFLRGGPHAGEQSVDPRTQQS
jgi:hypothetical protein